MTLTTTMTETDFQGDFLDCKDCIGARAMKRAYKEYRDSLPWYNRVFKKRNPKISFMTYFGMIDGNTVTLKKDGQQINILHTKVGDKVTFE